MEEEGENKTQESDVETMDDYKTSPRHLALRALIRHIAYFCAENDYKEHFDTELSKYNASKTGGVNT